MTPSKAGFLLGESLKRGREFLSHPRRQSSAPSPVRGKVKVNCRKTTRESTLGVGWGERILHYAGLNSTPTLPLHASIRCFSTNAGGEAKYWLPLQRGGNNIAEFKFLLLYDRCINQTLRVQRQSWCYLIELKRIHIAQHTTHCDF